MSVTTVADDNLPADRARTDRARPERGRRRGRLDGRPRRRARSTVPYASEDAARKLGVRVRPRRLDTGRRRPVGTGRRDLRHAVPGGGHGLHRRPGPGPQPVELNWEFAAEAVGEALKFLPEDAEVVPGRGGLVRVRQAGASRRARSWSTAAKLIDDLEYYEGTLDGLPRAVRPVSLTRTGRSARSGSRGRRHRPAPAPSAWDRPRRERVAEPAADRLQPWVLQHGVDRLAGLPRRPARRAWRGARIRTATSVAAANASRAWLSRRRANRCCDQPPAFVVPCTCRDPTFEAHQLRRPSNTPAP